MKKIFILLMFSWFLSTNSQIKEIDVTQESFIAIKKLLKSFSVSVPISNFIGNAPDVTKIVKNRKLFAQYGTTFSGDGRWFTFDNNDDAYNLLIDSQNLEEMPRIVTWYYLDMDFYKKE